MEWEAAINHALQTASNGFLDWLFYIISFFGNEIFVVVIMTLIYWCISKKTGLKFMSVFFISSGFNSVLKFGVKRPRPFRAYADESSPYYVRSIIEDTSGYSFPSGHTNTIATVGELSCLNFKKQRKIIVPVAICMIFLVMLSRLYLGQHYFTDVVISLLIATAFVFVLNFVYDKLGDKEERICYVGVPVAVIAFVIALVIRLVNVGNGTAEADGETVKQIMQITGVMVSLYVGYYIDKKYVGFDARASLVQNVLKLVVGGVVAAAIYFGCTLIFGFEKESAGTSLFLCYGFLRFFLLGAWITLGAPALFKKLGWYTKTVDIVE